MNSDLPKSITDRISIKNVKEGFGHDLAGLYCDIYVDGKKIGYHNNDGRGGETEYRFVAGGKEKLQEILEAAGYNKIVLAEYNAFAGSVKTWTLAEVDLTMQLDQLCETLVALRQFNKSQNKGIAYGKSRTSDFNLITWTNIKNLEEFVKKCGKNNLQKQVDRIKGELKEGERILNTNLEALGITM